jgi:protein involved in polysaccharide export with SLBB domain
VPVSAEDLKAEPVTDYVVGPNDTLRIGVFDLVGVGESAHEVRVTDTGMIAAPMLDEPIKAAGPD